MVHLELDLLEGLRDLAATDAARQGPGSEKPRQIGLRVELRGGEDQTSVGDRGSLGVLHELPGAQEELEGRALGERVAELGEEHLLSILRLEERDRFRMPGDSEGRHAGLGIEDGALVPLVIDDQRVLDALFAPHDGQLHDSGRSVLIRPERLELDGEAAGAEELVEHLGLVGERGFHGERLGEPARDGEQVLDEGLLLLIDGVPKRLELQVLLAGGEAGGDRRDAETGGLDGHGGRLRCLSGFLCVRSESHDVLTFRASETKVSQKLGKSIITLDFCQSFPLLLRSAHV